MIKFEENHIATQKEIDRAKRFYSFWYIPSMFFCWIGVLIVMYVGWDVYTRALAFMANHVGSPVDVVAALLIFVGPAAATIAGSGYVIGWFGKRVFAPRKSLKKLNSEDIDSILRLADGYPSLEEYRAKVAETRQFVVGDLYYMLDVEQDIRNKELYDRVMQRKSENENRLMKVDAIKEQAASCYGKKQQSN